MTLEEKMVFICRRCRHCYERHTSARIERRVNNRKSTHVCMVHARALSNNLKSSIAQVVPCAAQWRGKWQLLDFEMREVDE
jgi:hypothetical protein